MTSMLKDKNQPSVKGKLRPKQNEEAKCHQRFNMFNNKESNIRTDSHGSPIRNQPKPFRTDSHGSPIRNQPKPFRTDSHGSPIRNQPKQNRKAEGNTEGRKDIDQKKSRSNCCGLSISDGLHSLSGQLRKRQNRKRISRLEAAVRPRSPAMTDHSVQTRLPVRVYQQVPPKTGHPKPGSDWSKTVTDKGNNPPNFYTSCGLCGELLETKKLKVHEANCRKIDNQDEDPDYDPAGTAMNDTEEINESQPQPSPLNVNDELSRQSANHEGDESSRESVNHEGDAEPADKSGGATEKPFVASQRGASEEDGQCCTICFEPWTNSSEHRLVSLRCGHLFGRSSYKTRK